jgi:hypothetical protein
VLRGSTFVSPKLQFGCQVTQHPICNPILGRLKVLSNSSASNFLLARAFHSHGVIAMRFSSFDANTKRLLFDAYNEALASLSTDPALSLDLIYRCENATAKRLTELAGQGVSDRIALCNAAMKVVSEARAAEARKIDDRENATGRIDSELQQSGTSISPSRRKQ